MFRVEGKRGRWRAEYRLPDGRQVQRTSASRGPTRPAGSGLLQKRSEAWLFSSAAGASTLPGMVPTGVAFAEACEEYLRRLEQDRDRKPSTVRDYGSVIRAHLLPAFGSRRIEDIIDGDVERWKVGLGVESGMSNATKLKILTILSGVFERARKVHKLPRNPMAAVEKPIQRVRGDVDVFSVEEVALVRAAGRRRRSISRRCQFSVSWPSLRLVGRRAVRCQAGGRRGR